MSEEECKCEEEECEKGGKPTMYWLVTIFRSLCTLIILLAIIYGAVECNKQEACRKVPETCSSLYQGE